AASGPARTRSSRAEQARRMVTSVAGGFAPRRRGAVCYLETGRAAQGGGRNLPRARIQCPRRYTMSIELTREPLEAAESVPVRVTDPETHREYVLVQAEAYDRLRAALRDDVPDVAALVNEVMADDHTHDPYMESYQHYRKEAP